MKRIINSDAWYSAEHAFVKHVTGLDVSQLFHGRGHLPVRHEQLWIIRPRTLLHEIVG